ncbi:MAG: hypothetical protein GY836_11030 [Herbaspirillum sp.]|uniref:hypothetical protein n=1 Tax=Herbaspirillum sp. TaxID=1890675 RepID=UPI002585BFC7|nr:hypothetical protein [Herbaspirillum sp.]MCP4555946.1 hypothetical protein [Herbaspirillum sp.]
MKMREQKFSKNVTLKGKNIDNITDYMYKTRKNFSATLNIIIEQWDMYSIQIEKLKIQSEANQIEQLAKAKVLKE